MVVVVDVVGEHVEESSFILSRLAITTSSSRSNSKVCACDAGYQNNQYENNMTLFF